MIDSGSLKFTGENINTNFSTVYNYHLLGNALALVDPESEEQEIKQFIGNIKKVAEYVSVQQSKALGN